MTPYEQLEALYAEHPQQHPFSSYVNWHLHHGFVLSRPDVFVMARPMPRAFLESQGPTFQVWPERHCDTWFVHAAAGNIQRAWDMIPWDLPYYAWERVLDRRNELRFYEAGRVRRLFMTPAQPIIS